MTYLPSVVCSCRPQVNCKVDGAFVATLLAGGGERGMDAALYVGLAKSYGCTLIVGGNLCCAWSACSGWGRCSLCTSTCRGRLAIGLRPSRRTSCASACVHSEYCSTAQLNKALDAP